MHLRVGARVAGRFELEAVAGSGGMGTVYRARDTHTGDAVALKLVAGDREIDDRFDREAELLARLDHPHIVRHVAHGATAEGVHYLAMEWLEGEDLSVRLRRGPLATAEALRLLRDVAEALAEAHAHGVVHRDIKPGNLFLQAGDIARVKILDFGIARVLGAGAMLTRTMAILGTPGYMAPEQARGERGLDARADVFALGSVLYECLSGRAAFEADHLIALLAKIVLEQPTPLSELKPEIPAAVEALVSRLLAKDPSARPADGSAVLAEIDALSLGAVTQSIVATTLTSGEQRLLCAILLTPHHASSAHDPVATTMADAVDEMAAAREIVGQLGFQLEPLAGGAAIVALVGHGAATDQAALAARLALTLRSRLLGMSVALATGSGVWSGRLPFGSVVAAAAMLGRAQPLPGERQPVPIDTVTAGLLSRHFDVRTDGDRFWLWAERPQVDAAPSLLGRAIPFVGRQREMRALIDLYDECVAEPRARPVVMFAPSGMGKSRLRAELTRALGERSPAPEIWLARADEIGGAPFRMIAQLLCNAAGISDGEPAAVQQRKFAARIARRVNGPHAQTVAEFLGELAGIRFTSAEREGLEAARGDPQLMADRTRLAFERLLDAECAVAPLVLVLENLHWADPPSLRLLDGALRALADRPLMVLGLARPDLDQAHPDLWSERDPQMIRLGSLSKKASAELVRAGLGDDVRPDLVALLVERCEGNPLYLEESIRAVLGNRDEKLPSTVVAMVQARLESLREPLRRVLRAASIFGGAFWRGALVALLGTPADEGWINDALSELIEREVISPCADSRFAGDVELAFRHDLMREAAYAMLTDEDRRLGHRLAAEWIESAVALRNPGEHAAALEVHCRLANLPVRAASFARQAGHYAMRISALSEAIIHYQGALELVAQLPEDEATRALAIDLRLDVLTAMFLLRSGGDEGLYRLCRETELAAQALGDPKRLAQAYGWIGKCLLLRGDQAQVVASGAQQLARGRADDNLETMIVAAFTLAPGYLQTGALAEASQLAVEMRARLDEAQLATESFGQPYPPYITFAGVSAWVAIMRGDGAAAHQALARGRDIATTVGQRYALAIASLWDGWCSILRGSGAEVLASAAELARVGAEGGLVVPAMHALTVEGWGHLLSGDAGRAVERLEQALARSVELRYLSFRSDIHTGLLQAYFASGQIERAVATAEDAIHFAQSTGERRSLSEIQRILGEALAKREPDSPAARQHLAASQAWAEAMGATLFAERTRQSLERMEEACGLV
jgi:tetratricopeptide (TPR) repeat protein